MENKIINKILDKNIANTKSLKDLFVIKRINEPELDSVFLFNENPDFDNRFLKKTIAKLDIDNKYTLNDLHTGYLLYLNKIDDLDDLDDDVREYLMINQDWFDTNNEAWWKCKLSDYQNYSGYNKIWGSYKENNMTFCIDESDDYIGTDDNIVIYGKESSVELRFVLGILNSYLIKFYFKQNYLKNKYDNDIETIGMCPIPIVDKNMQKPLIDIVDKIILNKKNNLPIEDLEKILNKEVYALYKLNSDEINFIESQLK